MTQIAKVVFMAFMFSGLMLTGFADRGINKASKPKLSLNVDTDSPNSRVSLNLKCGVRYKGSLLSSVSSSSATSFSFNSYVKFQKGNTTYILPYKQKIVIPEIKQGYTGLKLIIKPN